MVTTNSSNVSPSDDPGYVSAYNQLMAPLWNLIQSLLGGTAAMRKGGQTFLPKEEEETTEKYKNRLKRSFLFNAYSDTVDSIVSKPFSEDVSVTGVEDNEFIERIENDADRRGRNITQFSSDLYRSAINYGMVSIVPDFPRNQITEEDGETRTANLKEERDKNIRPYFIRVDRPNILGFREDPDNPGILTQLRTYELTTEADGEFGEVSVEYVRVYERTVWKLYKNRAEEGYVLEDEGVNGLGRVPIVNIYFNYVGFMMANPALMDMAWLNLQHYQSSSDQNNILRFARTGTFFAAGFSKDEIDKKIVVGVDNAIKSTNPDAKFSVVEFQGHAISAGSDDLKQIEDRMEVLGAQPLVQQANSTATGAKISNNKKETFAQAWVRATEEGLRAAYEMAYAWYDKELPEDFTIDIYSDFASQFQSDDSMQKVYDGQEKGLITSMTTLKELQRRSIISGDIDIEKELNEAQEELAGRISLVTGMQENLDDDEDEGEGDDDEGGTQNQDPDENLAQE